MKKYFILSVLLLVSGFFASCNYLNIDDYFDRNLSPLFQSAVNSDMLFNFKCALFIHPVVHQVQT